MNGISELKIGAIIPTFNRRGALQKCLDCIAGQEIGDRPFKVVPIVIVDGSTDGTIEMIRQQFPGAEIVEGDGNWWYTKCINAGIKWAAQLNCDFVLTLNDDLIFSSDYVQTILADYFSVDRNSIIGSISLSQELPRRITFSGVSEITTLLKEHNYLPKFSAVEESSLSGIKRSVVLSGRGILYPMAIFEELGLYDEKLIQYSSETDFTYRASKAGENVWISYNAIVYENVQLTSAGAIYNSPSVRAFVKSLGNNRSINSFQKIIYYSIKHRGSVRGPIIAFIRMGGVMKKFLAVKLRTTK